MLFEDTYEQYKIYAKNRHKKQGFYNLTHDFEYRVLPYFKEKDIYKISKIDLLKWQELILSLNFSNSYNKRLYYVFNSFLDFCVKYYNLSNNLLRNIGPFPKRIEKKKHNFYTIKEFNKFIKYVDDEVYKQFFIFMFYTGTRPSEAMALKFSDLKGNYIIINKSIQRKGKREIDTPKNQSSVRSIIITKKLKKSLLKLRKLYQNYNKDYFIFGGTKPLSPTTIDRKKKQACKRANLFEITQHQFRHSHATLLVNNKIPINEISRRLGHSRISTTTDIYIHNDLTQEKRVLRVLFFQNLIYNLTHDFKSILKHFF